AQSKWVAERVVRIAASRGIPVSIYRPATIGGHSLTGVWNTDDYTCRLIKGCILLGAAPKGEHTFDIVAVDQVSRAIVGLSMHPGCIGQTYHFTNPNPITSTMLLDRCIALGYPVERVPLLKWRDRARTVAGNSPDHVLYPLLMLFANDLGERDDLSAEPSRRYANTKTCEELQRLGIDYESVQPTQLDRYFAYFNRISFL
ncbi:MAG: SDR family oxidoreductase, partial [Nitrospiraceae bacterium]